MHNRFAFIAGEIGSWNVVGIAAVRGDGVQSAQRIAVLPAGEAAASMPAVWRLDGVISNVRYATGGELSNLRSVQAPLGRTQADCAALIPIRKTPAWWQLAQDERRALFEEASHHTAIGLDYLPAIARQLYHARDLGEPFDFLTWFEYAAEHADAFEALVARLRATPEWTFVEREVDIRLARV